MLGKEVQEFFWVFFRFLPVCEWCTLEQGLSKPLLGIGYTPHLGMPVWGWSSCGLAPTLFGLGTVAKLV